MVAEICAISHRDRNERQSEQFSFPKEIYLYTQREMNKGVILIVNQEREQKWGDEKIETVRDGITMFLKTRPVRGSQFSSPTRVGPVTP